MKKDDVDRVLSEVALQHVGRAADLFLSDTVNADQPAIESAVERFRNGVVHARSCEHAMRAMAEQLFDESAPQAKPMESDAAYRERLKREMGSGSIYSGRVETAGGAALDEIGLHYGLKRR